MPDPAQPGATRPFNEDPGDSALVSRALEALDRAGAQVPADGPTSGVLEAVAERVEDVARRMRDGSTPRREIAGLTDLLIELQAVGWLLREHELAHRLDTVAAVHESLARLRVISDPIRLLAEAPREVCVACGFERAVLSRVEGSEWIVESAHFTQQSEWALAYVSEARKERAQLHHMLLETEMVRRRAPAIVLDAQNDPRTFKPIVEPSRSRSYVGAPVMPEGRVIGFVHADHYFSDRQVDLLDRDTLWTFAQGFGLVYERAVLLERLRSQRDQVRQMVSATDVVMNALCDAEIRLDNASSGEAVVARTAASLFVAPESRIESLLTRRELEVLALMSRGATNSAIAGDLVISEGTVKSHVKHILRKLRAANRAEAVSRYLRFYIGNEPDPDS